jgi:hypothetical protein
MGMTRQITLDKMRDIILNRLRVPQLMPFDVNFLCKKYIISVPNQVQYEKLLDDLEHLTKASTGVSNVGN